MENGTHSTTPNGDLTGHSAPAETPRAATFSSSARLTDSSAIASLLPPDVIDGASDASSHRSSMQPRVPSRQLLQTALDLAQKAVEMDKSNDVGGALAAYREAVNKLRIVMERVGVEPQPADSGRPGRNEDEGRTLRGIHDAYMARITLLSAYEGSDAEDVPAVGVSNLLLDSPPASATSTPPPGAQAILADMSPNGDPNAPLRSPATSSISKRIRTKTKQSFGLDEEADLTGLDGIGAGGDDENADAALESATSQAMTEAARSSQDSDDRPLPPLPATTKGASPANDRFVVNPPNQGTISQRRHHRGAPSTSSISELNIAPSPRGSILSLESGTRLRTMSSRGATYTNGDGYVPPVPPLQASYRSTLAPPARLQGSAYRSPRPEPQPNEVVLRPFHLLRILYQSMDASGPGAYLTSCIHIDPAMWKPGNWRNPNSKSGNVKVVGQEAKARCCDILIGHLEALKSTGAPLLEGVRDERPGQGNPARLSKESQERVIRSGDELSTLLDGLDDELDGLHRALTSKNVTVGSWKGKSKSSWGSRFQGRLDKMSSRNASDSPDKYVDLLSQLFFSSQVLDDHLRCFTGLCTPAYNAIPQRTYKAIETRLTRASQFYSSVIVPFVIEDFRQFMVGYLRSAARSLEDVA